MPALGNPRHEKFCQLFVGGPDAGNAAACYKAAGFKGDRREASKCRQRPDVSRRIDELMNRVADIHERATAKAVEAVVDRYAVTKERVLGELARLGFTNILDYGHVDDEGQFVPDLSAIDRDTAAGLVELTTEVVTIGQGDNAKPMRRTKIKLADKRAALVDLGRTLAMFVERKEVAITYADKTDAELRGEIARVVAELANAGVDIGGLAGDLGPGGGTQAPGKPH